MKQALLTIGLLLATAAPAWADDTKVIELNNAGVTALNKSNFNAAVDYFEKALAVDPAYKIAKDNLAITFNNKGLSIARANPNEALKLFHRALAIDLANTTPRQNLDGIIRMLGKNPKSFEDRAALGDHALQENDLDGAMIEYEAALMIKDDAEVSEKLGQLKLHSGIMIPQFDDRGEKPEESKSVPDHLAEEHGSLINSALAHEIIAQQRLKSGMAVYALKEFHQAAYINQFLDRDQRLKANIEGLEDAIRRLGKDPKNFGDRVELAEQAKKNGDFSGAVIEYGAALLIKDDPKIHRKLADAYRAKNEPDKAATEEEAARFLEGQLTTKPTENAKPLP